MRGCAALLLVCVGCVAQPIPGYQNTNLPFEKRVDDLVSRMTLEEKISQLTSDSAAIDRLGVPAYNWWNEALHGVARSGHATVFPQAIGMAATWDTNLMFRVATAISDEARAKNNEYVRRGHRNIYQGLTFWTPNINLFRDPRWGRGMETYGEDPYLTGRLAVAFIKGMQGGDPKYLKTVATAKHFAVHSGPESTRHTFDALVDDPILYQNYLPHFEAAVKEGGATSVMCAYNSVDGLPACGNPKLLEDILRKRWGFKGYVVSDCAAIRDIYETHRKAPDAASGVAMSIKAGVDLNCGVEFTNALEAVHRGLLTNTDINQAVKRLMLARFRLGMFDPPEQVKYTKIPITVNDSAEHRALAAEAARESIVLLKNVNRTLPLSNSIQTLAVIGPNADDSDGLLGNYNGIPSSSVTPLAGIRKKLGAGTRVVYARGADVAPGTPQFQPVPTEALWTSNGASRQRGLNGQYFSSANFDGKLHRPAELTYPSSGKLAGTIPESPVTVFTRVDPQINFEWGEDAPRPDMNEDDFGVRWTGYLSAPVTGAYQLGAIGMNAWELYLNGSAHASSNSIHSFAYQYAPVQLEAGKLYEIRLDYHEYANFSGIKLVWAPPGGPTEQEAVDAAKQADAIVLIAGLSPRLEGEEMKVAVPGFEGGDRTRLDLPEIQERLIQKIAALGKPTVLVLLNGSAVAINWARDHVPAIVEAWYPGEEGGTALADVLFGDANPGGRLPVTFYKSAEQLPPFSDYSMQGRTYRYFAGQTLFPFGFGLSYTTFAYKNLKVPREAQAGGAAKISVDVTNTGNRQGDEVVQVYLKGPGGAGLTPIRTLVGFERVALRPGETRTVSFSLRPRDFAHPSEGGHFQASPGAFETSVGGKQPGFSGPEDAATTATLSGRLRLMGPAVQVD